VRPSEQAERKRDASLGGESRMASCEHEAQKVVANVIVDGGVEILHGRLLLGLDLTTEFLVLALNERSPAQ